VPGTGELHAGLDDVLEARAGLPSASLVAPVGTAGAVHAGPPEGAAACPGPDSGQLGTKPIAIYVTSAMAGTGVGQSRRDT